jgi:hypothetical protein
MGTLRAIALTMDYDLQRHIDTDHSATRWSSISYIIKSEALFPSSIQHFGVRFNANGGELGGVLD